MVRDSPQSWREQRATTPKILGNPVFPAALTGRVHCDYNQPGSCALEEQVLPVELRCPKVNRPNSLEMYSRSTIVEGQR